MALAELRKSHMEGIFKRASPPAITERDRPSLAAAGQSSLTRSTPSLLARPSSRQSDCDDDVNWQRQQRASIKKGMLRTMSNTSLSSASNASSEDKHHILQKERRENWEVRDGRQGETSYGERKPPRRLPPMKGTRQAFADRTNISAPLKDVPQVQCDKERFDDVLDKKRARRDGQALAAACWEDLISFLELNKLSGAYALAFSAYGINDLSSLLRLDDTALGSLLEKCNIDSVDQILLLDAIRGSNPFR